MTKAIAVEGVGKRYPRYRRDRPLTLKGALLSGLGHPQRHEHFWALRNVDIEVREGRTVGLIGHNGAGKSTLLRLIAGVGRPDEGRIDVSGRISALFELGAGFHHELTGRESAMTAAVVSGLTRREARQRLDDIVAFAELEAFIDSPLRTYSTGMQARLAFSIAVHVSPAVLLIDEALSVGDLAFQQRCIRRIEEFQRAGATLLLVSHDPSLTVQLCDEVVWLRRGRVVRRGPAEEIVDSYREAMAQETRRLTPADIPLAHTPTGAVLRARDNRFGTQRATIEAVHVLDGWGHPAEEIVSGGRSHLELVLDVGDLWTSHEAPPAFQVGVQLVREDGLLCVEVGQPWSPASSEDSGEVRLSMERLDLAPGEYAFSVGLYSEDWQTTYDYHWKAYPLRILADGPANRSAALAPPVTWRFDH